MPKVTNTKSAAPNRKSPPSVKALQTLLKSMAREVMKLRKELEKLQQKAAPEPTAKQSTRRGAVSAKTAFVAPDLVPPDGLLARLRFGATLQATIPIPVAGISGFAGTHQHPGKGAGIESPQFPPDRDRRPANLLELVYTPDRGPGVDPFGGVSSKGSVKTFLGEIWRFIKSNRAAKTEQLVRQLNRKRRGLIPICQYPSL
jgi:hypothetical protein